jgi:hypothetical protein
MAGEIQIPIPVNFNPYKHHRNFILKFLEKASFSDLKNLTDSVCDNYIDIYTGNLAPKVICIKVADYLKSKQLYNEVDFKIWISFANEYRQIKLEDQSKWIIRKGNETERYIHIHPAKTGPFSFRFKGSTLKTIYRLKLEFANEQHNLSLEEVNRARTDIGLSPIKKLEYGKGIMKCWNVFFSKQGDHPLD